MHVQTARAEKSRALPPGVPSPFVLVGLLSVLALALRLAIVGQSLFADELATWWVVTTHDFGGVLSTVHSDAEITPPLYFVLSWLATQLDPTPELLRLPSLVAGVAAVPLTYLLGVRTVGRAAGLVGAGLVVLSPFMIFYSSEARGYALAIALVLGASVCMLTAIDAGGRRWWVLYAACSWAAVLTHYTTVFPLAAQAVWLLWAQPEARRAAMLANAGAALCFLPWITGLRNDLSSPTTEILSALEPFNAHTVRVSLEHWSVGYPLAFPSTRLRELPGAAALVFLALGLATATAGAVAARRRLGFGPLDRRLVLILALAACTAVGEALVSAVGTNLFGTRNLAVAWPALALAVGALIVAAPPWPRLAALVLVLACFAIGAVKTVESRFQRPDYEAVADFIDHEAAPGDVVVDGAPLTPGPLTSLDAALERPPRIFRVGKPQEKDHPFDLADPIPPMAEVTRRAATAAAGRRIFVVAQSDVTPAAGLPTVTQVAATLPRGWRLTESRRYPGILRLAVLVYRR